MECAIEWHGAVFISMYSAYIQCVSLCELPLTKLQC